MKLNFKHNLSKEAALAHVKQMLEEHRSEIEKNTQVTEERWEGDTLHFGATIQSQTINGTFTIKEGEYEIDVKLPFMLRMFEGRIKKAIEEQAGSLL